MIKRVFDIFFSSLGLLLLIPIFLLISFLVKYDSKGPVFFRQRRVGLNGKIFNIFKFRTMIVEKNTSNNLTIGDDKRITKVGRILRKYKLDELPQLIDVFLGRMSIVGPRPEVEEFIKMYPIDIRRKILSIKPGITDLASIEMINESYVLSKQKDPIRFYKEEIIPYKQKYYLYYLKNRSLFFDIKIIINTLKKIIF